MYDGSFGAPPDYTLVMEWYQKAWPMETTAKSSMPSVCFIRKLVVFPLSLLMALE
jgi:hypothetical protein